MSFPWFGNMTAKWQSVPIREVAALGTGHTPSRTVKEYWVDCTIPWVTVPDIRRHGEWSLEPLVETEQHINELGLANSAAVLHSPGTVMLSRTASIGFSCVIGREMATTQAFVTWTPNPSVLDSGYLHAALKAMRQQYDYLAYGATHLTIYFPDIKTLRIPLPPLDEQKAISSFLDAETAKIDGLVGEQRRLIELLKEKRQAVISHAVTKGLNPHAPLKPSSIEWLGDVPEHWELKPLKYLGKIVSGFAFNSSDFSDSGVRVLKIANIQTFSLDWSDESFLPEEFYDEHEAFAVLSGDVVFALTRPIISTGLKAAIADVGSDRVLLNQRNAIFRPNDELFKRFFYHVLFSDSFRVDFENKIDFTGQQPNISPLDIRDIQIPFPPTEEQELIAEFLDSETTKFVELMTEAERGIELLQERRTALISAAVTGKIDVRDFGQTDPSAYG